MKNAVRTVCLVAVWVLLGRAAALAGLKDFTLVNQTGFEISEIYVSPAGTDDWQEDLLTQDSLENGKGASLHFDAKTEAAKFDFKIVDEEGDEIVWKGVNLLKAAKVTLRYENKKPTVEVE